MTERRPWTDEAFSKLLRDAAGYYTQRIRERGDGAEGMDWRDRSSQYLRFERLMLHLGFARGVSLLDVGCGSGELLAFCRQVGCEPEYLGIDVSPDMVAACNCRFGADSASGQSLAELARQAQRFDYVVASGTFNVCQQTPQGEWRRYFYDSVIEMFELARCAVAFNVMSSAVDFRYGHLYYADVGEMAELAGLCGTRRFLIDHSYPLFEMTVTLFKDEEGR
jgi:SAM-dependent methyltransferase